MYTYQRTKTEGLSSFFGAVFGLTGIAIAITAVLSSLFAPLLIHNGFMTYVIVASAFMGWGLNCIINEGIAHFQIKNLLLLSLGTIICNSFFYTVIYFIGYFYGFDLVVTALIGTIIVFAVSCGYGMITNKDLSSIRNLIIVVAVSLAILAIVEIAFYFLLPSYYNLFSIIGSFVSIIFSTLLISYEMNILKQFYFSSGGNHDTLTRISIMGALILYNSFFNLLLNILNILMRLKDRDQ